METNLLLDRDEVGFPKNNQAAAQEVWRKIAIELSLSGDPTATKYLALITISDLRHRLRGEDLPPLHPDVLAGMLSVMYQIAGGATEMASALFRSSGKKERRGKAITGL